MTNRPTVGNTPVAPGVCPTGKEIDLDTFSWDTEGWNCVRTTLGSNIGTIIGPFGNGSPNPSSTLYVGTDAANLRIQFDFLELDSWDSTGTYGPDSLQVRINNELVDIGTFQQGIDEGSRSGRSNNGIQWSMWSKSGIINIDGTNDSYTDEVHVISMVVPRALYSSGSLTMTFIPNLSESISNESAGFDNIRVSQCGIPELERCTSQRDIAFDTFDDGDEGWTNSILTTFTTTGQFLGRYALYEPTPSKTYTVTSSFDYVQVEFDFLQLDSWDWGDEWGYDHVIVNINGETFWLGNLSTSAGNSGWTTNGIRWFVLPQGDPSMLGGNERWTDEIHLVSAYVPWYLAQDGRVTLSFEMKVSSSKSDESAGFDNIRVRTFSGCMDFA